jgi:hypothetical protein
MKPRTLAILVALGIVALVGGWYFGIARAPEQQTPPEAGHLMFPDLAAHLADATQVELVHGASTIRLVKPAKSDDWGLAERGGYRIDAAKLRGLLTGLTELRLLEPRTADSGELGRLGLEDPTGKDATSTLVRVADASGHPIAAVITGHTRVRTEGNLPPQVYVRRPDQNQTWLAEGRLDVDTDPLSWLDRDIMDIKPARIASVGIANGDAHMLLARSGDALTMQQPADHPPLDAALLDDVTRALDSLTLEDVAADKDEPKGDALGTAVFTTKDGLAITATPVKAGDDLWVRFAASGGDGKAAAEAAALNARLSGWAYKIGVWKQKALAPTLDDLKAPPPKAPAAAPTPAKP